MLITHFSIFIWILHKNKLHGHFGFILSFIKAASHGAMYKFSLKLILLIVFCWKQSLVLTLVLNSTLVQVIHFKQSFKLFFYINYAVKTILA